MRFQSRRLGAWRFDGPGVGGPTPGQETRAGVARMPPAFLATPPRRWLPADERRAGLSVTFFAGVLIAARALFAWLDSDSTP
ncbi:MAG TPA: hypothetical protein VFC53_10190 [Dehalococcoidia bacterium]|nr:hypothetical protein [Dehalococcoidia bacterium]